MTANNPDLPPVPVKDLESFTFSISAAKHALKETEALLMRYEAQLDEIINSCTVGGHPLVNRILEISHERDEIRGLASGLAKAANLVPVLDKLQVRKQTLELAISDPSFMAWSFGDFTTEADQLMEALSQHLEESIA